MRTGQVATEAGVNAQTLRYYERRGLLKRPRRTPSGYREYAPDAVTLIRFVKAAQALGFTLDEIEELLELRDGGGGSCAEVRSAAEAKVADIDAKIASLKAMKRALGALVASCARNQRRRNCPLLESLDLSSSRGKK